MRKKFLSGCCFFQLYENEIQAFCFGPPGCVCRVLNYIDDLLIETSTITGCVSISAFGSLVRVPIGIASPGRGLKICAITAGIKRYKSMIKKMRKKHDEIVLLAKSKLNSI